MSFKSRTFQTSHTIPEKKFKCEISDAEGKIVSAGHGETKAQAKEKAAAKMPEGSQID